MKRATFFAAAFVFAMPAAYGDGKTVLSVKENHPTLQFSDTGRTVALLEDGGCIVGPFTVFKEDGTVLAKIGTGEHMPSGCGK